MFKKLKGKLKGDDQTASGSSHSQNQYYASPDQQQQHSAAPTEKYQAPTGPPPGYSSSKSDYAPPPGPPPAQKSNSGYAPPPGPPPSNSNFPQQPPPSWDPPPYHDWTVIPDTALLPPPPSLGYESSPTANSTMEEGDRAYNWCQAHPLWSPQNLHPQVYHAIQNAQLALLKAPTFLGELLPQPQAGHWRCHSHAACRDSSILTNLPMYTAQHDSPLVTSRPKTIYFELKVTGLGHGGFSLEEADAGIAIGFVAPPYPTFRLPGWQRGSLGVHGDDGRKYVNDTWGGVDFTTAFAPGETVGIGMTFSVPRAPPGHGAAQQQQQQYGQGQQQGGLDVEVFFTRNGKKEGGWDGNLDEQSERSEGGTIGLRGECDLFPAVGVFGGVDFDVFFHPAQWLYRPF
jgi:hypothetical protein